MLRTYLEKIKVFSGILVFLYEVVFLFWYWEVTPEIYPSILNTPSISFNIHYSAFSDKVCLCILLGFSEYLVIVYIITLFVFAIETIRARRWQSSLCVESKQPLSYGVLNHLNTNLNSRKSGHNLCSSTSRRCSVNQDRHLSVQSPTDSSCTLCLHVKYTYVISVNKLFICLFYFRRVSFEHTLLNNVQEIDQKCLLDIRKYTL
jgi:hypothetical protein